jgi:hypothetical protein
MSLHESRWRDDDKEQPRSARFMDFDSYVNSRDLSSSYFSEEN